MYFERKCISLETTLVIAVEWMLEEIGLWICVAAEMLELGESWIRYQYAHQFKRFMLLQVLIYHLTLKCFWKFLAAEETCTILKGIKGREY